jgi:O-antigen/teichoic acid export membrane protein
MMEDPQAATGAPPLSIGVRMARGAYWMVAMRSADRVLGLISMLVLARLLVPADFGLLALGMAVVGSLSAFSEFSFDMALIQNQTADRRHYDTAWTLGILRGMLLAAILLLLAEPAADVMGEARLAPLISVLALVPFLEGLANIGVVDFRKELAFGKEFHYTIFSRIGGVITTVCLAIFWRDYWALVVGQLAVQVLRLVLSYRLHPYRPRLSLAAWRELVHFSKWLLANGMIAVGIKRTPTFVIGAFMSVASVGLFGMSSAIAEMVSQSAIAPIKRAFFPGYAKLGESRELLNTALLRAHGIVVYLGAPATIGIGLTAELIVPLALGQRWLGTVPIVEILAIDAFLAAMQGQVRPVFMAVNRPELTTYLSVTYALALIPALVCGGWLAGLLGVAWAVVGARLVQLIAEYYALERILRISFRTIVLRLWRSMISCLALIAVVSMSKRTVVLPNADHIGVQLYNLGVVVLLGAASYALSVLCLWYLSGRPADSAEAIILSTLKGFVLKRVA